MSEYRYVGSHADELDGGRPLAPGDFTGPIDADLPKNKQLLDDELLIEVPDGSLDAARKAEGAETSPDNGENLQEPGSTGDSGGTPGNGGEKPEKARTKTQGGSAR